MVMKRYAQIENSLSRHSYIHDANCALAQFDLSFRVWRARFVAAKTGPKPRAVGCWPLSTDVLT